jgi:SARP family transcriptional regulator, regulator of embCAB operon
LASPVPERIQLCGPLVVEGSGERWEGRLPGRQGRLLFVYLVLQRHRLCSRHELAVGLWGEQQPTASDAGLNALISKLRKVLGPEVVHGRTSVRLRLGDDLWVDVEAAQRAVHRAESRIAQQDWRGGWGPALAALFIADRDFLPGEEASWIDDERSLMSDIRLRALEAYAAAALGVGGTELPAAVRAARRLVGLVPLRESGHQLLMRALASQGNQAEALRVHADLCRMLRDELGVSPSRATQEVYQSLLQG